MCKTRKFHIGTSGWHYKHWLGNFYPDNLTEKDYLKFYLERFCSVEINNSFYHLPSEKAIIQWAETVPDDFLFAVKASRYITHMKKLTSPEQSTELFFERIKYFRDRLGPILFQLPPRFRFNAERLDSFLKILPGDYKYAFEFRDPSWFNEEVYEILRKYNIAFCIYYLGGIESPKEITADFVYIRYHGTFALGAGLYDYGQITNFSNDIKSYIYDGKEVYAYFNNDQAGFAARNAAELNHILTNS